MALVGDVILSFRELATDRAQVIPAPVINGLANVNIAGGMLAPSTRYFTVATAETIFGESAPSDEQAIQLGPGDNAFNAVITVASFVNSSALGVTAIRVYFGLASGVYQGYQRFTTFPNPYPVPGPIVSLIQPPGHSTAYLPDSDGPAVGAFAAYRWLNQALAAAAAKNKGGVPDFGAAGTVSGQPIYNLAGYWKKLDTAWYDGYPLYLGRKNDVFRKNLVTGYVGTLGVYQASDRLIVECWPQPSRTSGGGPLQANITATATTATMTAAGAWVLSFGLAQIGAEIVEYAKLNGNQLIGLTRGMCGTVPSAHTAGETVTELNLMYSGFRVPSTYTVGQSLSTLYLPPGWDEAIMSYMLYRFRSAEQDDKAAGRYLQEFNTKMQDLTANRIIAGPRQIQANAGRGAETMAGLGSPFGGVIVP